MKLEEYRQAFAVVKTADGRRVLGSGFFVGRLQVLTCDHVVTSEAAVLVDFPFMRLVGIPATVAKRVPSFEGYLADAALLTLHAPPRSQPPSVTLASGSRTRHRMRAFGFPRGFDTSGLYATATIDEELADGTIQFTNFDGAGPTVEHGFSGAAVYDEDDQEVVGMVRSMAEDRATRTGFYVPAHLLLRGFPELAVDDGVNVVPGRSDLSPATDRLNLPVEQLRRRSALGDRGTTANNRRESRTPIRVIRPAASEQTIASMEPKTGQVTTSSPNRTRDGSNLYAWLQQLNAFESLRALTDRVFEMTALVDEESDPTLWAVLFSLVDSLQSSFVQAQAGYALAVSNEPQAPGARQFRRLRQALARLREAVARRTAAAKALANEVVTALTLVRQDLRTRMRPALIAYEGVINQPILALVELWQGVTVLGVDWTTCERALIAPGAVGYPRCEAAGQNAPLIRRMVETTSPSECREISGRWMEDLDRAVEAWSGPPRGARTAVSRVVQSGQELAAMYFQLLDDRIRGSLAAA